MHITLNGKDHTTPDKATLQDLLDALELTGQRVAVLLDDEVVRKANLPDTPLTEGCSVELVQMVGGG